MSILSWSEMVFRVVAAFTLVTVVIALLWSAAWYLFLRKIKFIQEILFGANADTNVEADLSSPDASSSNVKSFYSTLQETEERKRAAEGRSGVDVNVTKANASGDDTTPRDEPNTVHRRHVTSSGR